MALFFSYRRLLMLVSLSADDPPDLADALGTTLAEQERAPQHHVLAVVLSLSIRFVQKNDKDGER